MQLQDDDIREFSDLWRQEFGEKPSESDARHCATQLLELYLLLARSSEGSDQQGLEVDSCKKH